MRRDYCASGPSRSVTEVKLSDTDDRREAPQERRGSMHMGFWTGPNPILLHWAEHIALQYDQLKCTHHK